MAVTKRSVVGLVLGLVAGAVWAGRVPEAVSPGATNEVARVGGGCPTFSWGGAEEARAYEVVVYEFTRSEAEGESRPVVQTRISGSASSWTPSLGQCLESGKRYVWFVRAVGPGGPEEWSEGRVFEVMAEPKVVEVGEAVQLLERYLDASGAEEASAALGGVAEESGSNVDVTVQPKLLPEAAPEAAAEITTTGVEIAEASITIAGMEVVTAATDRDTLGGMSCVGGQVAKWDAGLSQWECGDDDGGTSYVAGNQLTLDGHTFHVLEGPGSDLDADQLDGSHAADFAQSGHDHHGTYVNETGDLMTGDLQIKADTPRVDLNTTGTATELRLQQNDGDKWSLGWNSGSEYLYFYDWAPPGGTRMVIDDDTGNVGIGTATPGVKLDVQGLARVIGGSWPTSGEGMELGYNPGFTPPRGYIQVFDRDLDAWGDLYLGDGRVGIGTMPTEKLEVAGTVKADSLMGDGSGLTGVTAATATQLATDGDNCVAGWAAAGVDSQGHVQGCFEVPDALSDLSGPLQSSQLTGTYSQQVTLGNALNSFAGDGSGLTGVTAASATQLAANGSNCGAGLAARGVDVSGNAEACFDTATQTELNTHKGSGDHDAAYVNSTGDTMTGPLTLSASQPQLKLSTSAFQSDLLFQKNGSSRWGLSWNEGSGYLSFYDYQPPGGTRMVIDDTTGNVGIGTAPPGARLDVGGLARVGGSVWPTAGQGMELGYSSELNRGYVQVFNRNSDTWGELYLGNGRVSIGTVSPGTRLDIVGSGTATGGVVGYDEVMARFKQTVLTKHSAIVVDALNDQDPIIYLSEGGQPSWGIRSNNVEGTSKSTFEVRYHTGGENGIAMQIGTGTFGESVVYPTSFNGNVYPSVDNRYKLGTSTRRWKEVWATNPIIQISDQRLKDEITALDYGLPEILRLRPVSYLWKDSDDRRTQLGLVAQEVEPLIPEAVRRGEGPEEPWAMTYSSLTPVLIKAIQDQQEIIEGLRVRIESLEKGL